MPNLVTTTASSRRRPRACPRILSEAPMPYPSAVSKHVMPRWSARPTARTISASSMAPYPPPASQHPTPTTETSSPVRPNGRYSICHPSLPPPRRRLADTRPTHQRCSGGVDACMVLPVFDIDVIIWHTEAEQMNSEPGQLAPNPTDVDPLDLVDPERYAQRGYPHDLWRWLRAEAPVAHFAPPGYAPFWAITKHADVQQIAAQPERFSSGTGIALRRANAAVVPPSDILVLLDPPRHGPMRRVANGRFTPRAVRARSADIDRISVEILEHAPTVGDPGELDFVERIAAPFPLWVIAWILGVPHADVGLLFRWTNEVIGKDDPEYRRPGESPGQTIKRARGELRAYLGQLIERRRSDPEDDLVTEWINATGDGAPPTQDQRVPSADPLAEAGNETT